MTEASPQLVSGAFGLAASSACSQVAAAERPKPIDVRIGFGRGFASLLSQAKQGDGRAFREIDEVLGGRIHAFIASRGVEDPDGLTNEVFLGAFRSIQSFDGNESAFVGWVFSIARNKIVDDYRRRDRRPAAVPVAEPVSRATEPSAEERALADVELSDAYRLLDPLTDDQREIVLLRVVSGLSFAEIGRAVGKRTGAAKAAYRRAVKTAARVAADGRSS